MRIDAHVMRIGRCIRMAKPSTDQVMNDDDYGDCEDCSTDMLHTVVVMMSWWWWYVAHGNGAGDDDGDDDDYNDWYVAPGGLRKEMSRWPWSLFSFVSGSIWVSRFPNHS